MKIGAIINNNEIASFRVWAPRCKSVSLKIVYPEEKLIPMIPDTFGYWQVENVHVKVGNQYFYRLNDEIDLPDPASHFQPLGVHGPSEVISPDYSWHDTDWEGVPLEKLIIYELHVGTFTKEGTFDGAINKIGYLKQLGITAVEIMPVAQFPGERNWGYDGAYHFAVQNSYGGPEGLKRLVDKCHQEGISVIMDVVYNHFGPEGAYANQFGYYFTNKYQSLWGAAINFDDEWCDGVRNYFIENALYWFDGYHIDALRLDAIHGIFDFGGKHFLRELAEKTECLFLKSGWKRFLIAESDLNDVRVISPFEMNGYGLDAQWDDDFHHAIIALVTGERKSYYRDFGSIEQLAKAYSDGFVYSWDYSANRKRHHGTSSVNIPGKQLVVCIQNHDQVGNRLMGERVSHLVNFDALKILAGALLIAPYIPLIFMGEEFAADTPFMYFISHGDEALVEAVRIGRAKEFADMHNDAPAPDSQSKETFDKCKLNWDVLTKRDHQCIFNYYKKLIGLRKEKHALSSLTRNNITVKRVEGKDILVVDREIDGDRATAFMNFSTRTEKLEQGVMNYSGVKILDSSEELWHGSGTKMPEIIYPNKEYELSPYQFVLYEK